MTRSSSSEKTCGFGRLTAARRALLAATDAMPRAFTVEDLVKRVRADGVAVSTATAYRTVAVLESGGHLERIGIREGAALYAHCGRAPQHHHHVVCNRCGRVAPTECALAADLARAAAETGFSITHHELVLHGLCPTCARPRSA